MVLITTRMSVVAEKVGTLDPFEIKSLPPEIYWDLFKRCAFGSFNSSSFPELEGIGKKIAAKMKGSPLAAKTLGGILSADMNIEKWKKILNSELWQIEQSEGDILPALRISYQYLPAHLKRCFQILSLFPMQYHIDRDILSPLWVSDGIINKEDEKGPKYIQDLENKYFIHARTFSIIFFHDLIHDLACSLSLKAYSCIENNNWSLENYNSVHHLSVFRGTIELIDKEIVRCKNLRSLLFLPRYSISLSSSTLFSLFDQLTDLRFLYLKNCQIEELPENIGNLKLLIHINLRHTKIKSLPNSICQLYNLQVVDVDGCPLESFPKLFHRLTNMRLIAEYMEISTKISCIGKLTSLETLGEFKVLKKDEHKIEELKDMNRLRGWLNISELENVEGREDAARACLHNKEYVNCLNMSWSSNGNTSSRLGESVADQNIIEGLQPHPNLNLERLDDWFLPCQLPSLLKFIIKKCESLLSLPLEWINNSSITSLTVTNCSQLGYLNNLMFPSSLTCLELDSCGEFDMTLPGCLMNLNSLYTLRLNNCQHVTSLPGQVTHRIKVLMLHNCTELQCLELSNPSILKSLKIMKCPKLIQSGPLCQNKAHKQ